MKRKKIITHHGFPHMDDFISVCLVLASDSSIEVIERREVKKTELNDANIWVLDVGFHYDPSMKNFDHHQFSIDKEECTLSLLVKYFGMEEEFNELPWFRPLILIDTLGPQKAAQKILCNPNQYTDRTSPIDHYLLSLFEKEKSFSAISTLGKFMRNIGQDIFETIKIMKEQLILLKTHAEILKIEDINVIFLLEDVFIPGLAVEKFIRNLPGETGVFVSRNRRNSGFSLRRLNDHTSVDFRKLKGKKEINFIHSSGFVAKTITIDRDRLIDLVTQSITK